MENWKFDTEEEALAYIRSKAGRLFELPCWWGQFFGWQLRIFTSDPPPEEEVTVVSALLNLQNGTRWKDMNRQLNAVGIQLGIDPEKHSITQMTHMFLRGPVYIMGQRVLFRDSSDQALPKSPARQNITTDSLWALMDMCSDAMGRGGWDGADGVPSWLLAWRDEYLQSQWISTEGDRGRNPYQTDPDKCLYGQTRDYHRPIPKGRAPKKPQGGAERDRYPLEPTTEQLEEVKAKCPDYNVSIDDTVDNAALETDSDGERDEYLAFRRFVRSNPWPDEGAVREFIRSYKAESRSYRENPFGPFESRAECEALYCHRLAKRLYEAWGVQRRCEVMREVRLVGWLLNSGGGSSAMLLHYYVVCHVICGGGNLLPGSASFPYCKELGAVYTYTESAGGVRVARRSD